MAKMVVSNRSTPRPTNSVVSQVESVSDCGKASRTVRSRMLASNQETRADPEHDGDANDKMDTGPNEKKLRHER